MIEDQPSEPQTHQYHPGIAVAVRMQLRQLQDFLRGQRARTLRAQLQEMRSTAARGVHGVHSDMVRDSYVRNYTEIC